MLRTAVLLMLMAVAGILVAVEETTPERSESMSSISESYVKLVLAVGQHDKDYVDAYYGPREWKEEAGRQKRSLEDILKSANEIVERLRSIDVSRKTEEERLRHEYLLKQTFALIGRVELLHGKKRAFDEEARAIYGVTPPHFDEAHFNAIHARLSALLPGEGDLPARYQTYTKAFIVPSAKFSAVFDAALKECRKRTSEHIPLPKGENFRLEFVTGKPWSGYNWYQGNYFSLIQINTELPIYIDRAMDLAGHEGYPGHHVYNLLLEKNYLRDKKWMEFSVYPLFSPQSLVAEGTANYGLKVLFTDQERIRIEKEVLFPLAGLDPNAAEKYYKIKELTDQLNYARNEAARNYLDGKWTREEAQRWLAKYQMLSPERAVQQLQFIEKYRTYVINYNLGKDLVSQYVEAKLGAVDNRMRRWQIFADLISSPRLLSN